MHPMASDQPPLLPASNLRKGSARRRALIGMTPLIDVVFILLVFFMLASSFLDWRAIDLTAPAKASASGGMDGALLVEIRPEGLRLAGEALPPEALIARVAAHVLDKPEQKVLVRPAAGVALQDAVRLLDGLAAAGATELSLIREGNR